mgnify:CR=1 FL=1
MGKIKKRDNSIDFLSFEYNYFNTRIIRGLVVSLIAMAIIVFFVIKDLLDNGAFHE